MDKTALLNTIQTEYAQFESLIAPLSETQLCTAPLLKSTTIVYMPKGKTIAGLSPASRQAISGPAMATAASRLSRYTGKAYRSKQAIGASQCTFDRSSHPEAARVCYG